MMEENMFVIRDPETFCFKFHLLKDVDKNLKCKIEFIMKNDGSLAGNKKKTRLRNYC